GGLGTGPSPPMGHVGKSTRSPGEHPPELAPTHGAGKRTSPECARDEGLIRGRRAWLVAQATGLDNTSFYARVCARRREGDIGRGGRHDSPPRCWRLV